MPLEVALRHRLGAFALDAAFEAPAGVTALFGPSGSGKTTVANAVAGLLAPSWGRVAVDGRVLLDTEEGVAVPAHRRRVGYVFQEGRLFPHLSVRGNLMFGHRLAPRRARREDPGRVIEMLGIGPLLGRRTRALSGGEKQRVAIGRALLSGPRLLVMDEPLASLDEARRGEILPHLERLRDEAGVPVLYVSHSAAEIRRLATTVVVMEEGRVARTGAPAEVLPGPGAEAVLLDGRAEGGEVETGIGRLRPARVPHAGAVRVRIEARDVMLAVAPPEGIGALLVLPVVVTAVRPGPEALVELAHGGHRLRALVPMAAVEALGLAPGAACHAAVRAAAVEPPPAAPAWGGRGPDAPAPGIGRAPDP